MVLAVAHPWASASSYLSSQSPGPSPILAATFITTFIRPTPKENRQTQTRDGGGGSSRRKKEFKQQNSLSQHTGSTQVRTGAC